MKKYYNILYASRMLSDPKYQNTRVIFSSVDLKKDDFIVVENRDEGVFIGKVLEEVDAGSLVNAQVYENYSYVQHIDLSNYLQEKENAKRKEELKVQMEKRFAEIDKEKKYQYYAELDADFKAMFEEYKKL